MKAEHVQAAPETTEKRAHRHALPLTDEAIELIRNTSEYTGVSIADIKEAIGATSKLTELVEEGCRAVVEGHEKEQQRRKADLFRKKPVAGKPAHDPH